MLTLLRAMTLSTLLLLVQPLHARALDVDDYRKLARQFTEESSAVGIIGTIYEYGKFHDFAAGTKDAAKRTPIDEDTLLELGSATKAFTGTLLARELVLGHLRLDQVVSEFFPELGGTPVGAITVRELATHTSGLPRMPDNLVDSDGDLAAYRDYSLEMLLEYAKGAVPGDKAYKYSNVGVAILSQILIVINRMSYSEMIRAFIQEPLGLDGLETDWSDAVAARLSMKYSSILRPEPYWTDLNAMNGTGIIKISVRSMKKFLLAQLYPEDLSPPLRDAILLSHQMFAATDDFKIGLGWFEDTINDVPYINHNGSTEGFSVECLVDVENERAFFVASNTDLLSPGLCLADLFTGAECAMPRTAPIADGAKYVGVYVAGAGDAQYEFEISVDDVYGFLYVTVDGDIEERLFYTDESTLETDAGTIVLKFNGDFSGELTDNWDGRQVMPFVRTSPLPST